MTPVTVALEPVRDEHLVAAIEGAGGRIVGLDDARVLVWIGPPGEFPELPDAIEWVALKTAGIEDFLAADVVDDRRIWTNASGFYAENVAEHALTLLLAGLRQINTVAVNRSGREVPGAHEVRRSSELDGLWGTFDHVVLAAPSTPETRHMINADSLAALPAHAWVVNVARGPLVDEEALFRALVDGQIAGAALDVTDPEPPADDHPFWSLPNVIITPHVANPASGLTRELAPWVAENLRRFAAGEELLSVVTPKRDY